ncbi:acyl-CoA dehydrogenase [Panacagrimonas sp.]|uniref:acyl-CoA dehydrogenase n=1 Tax=Panacagrimonas sp. TaxID=2480088 RepID=UPI003B52730B
MFAQLMKWMRARRLLPSISDTERQALEAGTVWIDGDFFRGKPNFVEMLRAPYSKLSDEEQAFLDGPVEQLLGMIDPYTIGRTKRVPDEVLQFIKDQGFMSFLIPREYGGKQFSTLAISTIMAKIGPVSATVGTLVVIPNSLGAAELIIHYGTQAQKDDYLPKLASGEYVPCFGLTEPTAGSDAASIKATGEVFRDTDGDIKLRLNFRKRYITLAPIANLCTIACRLHDPEKLLGKTEDLGITCVMVHKGTPGFTSGDHHDPIGDPFYNGPLEGRDVVVPVDNIIGGPDCAGEGWKMLMQQLAGGRAVSLPAGAVGGAKAVAVATGAYSMVRQQFGLPIGRMEGVEEKVGRIAGLSYLLEAARVYGCSAVDAGQQPPVVSAVLKAYTTEISQHLAIDGMDVFAGAAVMQGPNNILGMGYKSAPVGVTVEGANILTRTLMIFGQGATRCHPYALKVVEAVEKDDADQFRGNLLGWMKHFGLGLLRAEGHYLTRGLFVSVPDVAPETRSYYRRLGWAAARFGVMTDLAMFAIGGKLKRRGKLTGRYADVLAWLVLGMSTLRRYEAEGRREDLPLVRYALNHCLWKIQEAFVDIYRNFDGPLGWWLKTVGVFELRINPLGAAPTDAMSHAAALCIQSDNEQFRRLAYGVYLPKDTKLGLGRLLHAFLRITRAHPAAERIIQAQKARKLPRGLLPAEAAEDALKAGIINDTEAALLRQALEARLEAIEVDVFSPEAYFATVNEGGGLEYRQAVNG